MVDNIKYVTQAFDLSGLKMVQEQKKAIRDVVNEDTGEVRSKMVSDAEVNSGQYIVDDTDYVPLATLIKRCDRKTMAASLQWFAKEDEPDYDEFTSEDVDSSDNLTDDSLQVPNSHVDVSELSPANGSEPPIQTPIDAVENSGSSSK
ncbi:hypothetical protein [Sigmofec virus UA08Rod_6752]|uniref:Uncharacterized protein n=1 Tax=Sigmofec virus UA08Rod_6752 TaxID=2929239 RepID=A0A976N075_9VIRU|nr:hypothetical protein [Sigmofec virus UA08Rod_6752]